MGRLGILGTSLFVAGGVVAAAALLPFSNWSFRHQTLMLRHPRNHLGNIETQYAASRPVLPEHIWNRNNRDDSLARAFAMWRRWTEPAGFEERWEKTVPAAWESWHKAFEEHEAKFPKDAEGIAGHLRLLLMTPMVLPATERPKDPRLMKQREFESYSRRRIEAAQDVLRISEKGTLAEPGNAFFRASRAMALNVLSRFDEARQEIYRAAELTRFDDHSLSEAQILVSAVERKLGYRGEAFRTVVYASIVLPHFASIRATVVEMQKRCPESEKLKARWALYRVCYVLARESATRIGILVGKAGMNSALASKDDFKSAERNKERREKERQRFFELRSEMLGSELHSAELIAESSLPHAMLDEASKLQDGARRDQPAYDQSFFDNLFLWPTLAAKLLMGLLGAVVALPLVRLWAMRWPEAYGRTRGTIALVALGLFVAVFVSARGDSPLNWAPLAMTAPVLALAMIQAKGGSLKLPAIAYPIALLLMGLFGGILGSLVIAALGIVGIGLIWLSGRWPWLASLMALAAAGIAVFSMRAPEFATMGFLLAVPMALAAAALLLAFPARWVDRGAAAAVLALTAGYAFAVVRDVADNAYLAKLNPQFLSEADRVREKAGLPRLSESRARSGRALEATDAPRTASVDK